MAVKLNLTSLASIGALITPVIASAISGKGARYQKIANQAVRSAVTATNGGIDHLVTSFKTFESENPLVQTAISEFATLAVAAGVSVPSLDAVQSHLKSAIYDLATTLVPLDQLTDATSDDAASGAQTEGASVEPAAS
ncbi:hypothetical protein [Gluconobacter frateurii]|uniref:Holin n=1 Tax=Gluconobacter frateurii NRIC 0228 TaxID=1307946 RepID=A0ABQ0Q8Z3_9PROT|nr:hypothetical protein [Gluconobacter frateurii]GBR09461.1 hypothetical protein AA0228_0683 [Gluconobacter frateurii NRIC 0228]GLP91954.1 hypothetical protein GCM10007868_30290 [Gluconobacter frateurii]